MKSLFENYGWILIVLLVISILIGLASPLSLFYSDKLIKDANNLTNTVPGGLQSNLLYSVKITTNIPEAGKAEFSGDYSGTKIHVRGENVVTFKAIVNEGYEFLGWYVENTLISNEQNYASGYTVTKQTTITAKYRSLTS